MSSPNGKAVMPTTICTCIEAGGLERQVLLLVESLRLFGGKWAQSPVYAVKPRRGPALQRETVKRLKELGAFVIDEPVNDVVPWWDMANKPASLRYVEEHTDTPYVTWMDGDMMVLQEPDDFAPAPGKTFKGRAGEAHDVASNGTGEGAAYWRKLCEVFGLDFDAFPEIISFPDKKPIKAYWQGGLFTYPRETKFGAQFYDLYSQMLRTPIASKTAGTYHQDQVSLALTVQVLKLDADQYDPRMNFNFNYLDKELAKLIPLPEIQILHYHGSFWPENFGWAREQLAVLPADRLELIDRYAPLSGGSSFVKLQRKLFRKLRSGRLNAFEQSVVKY